MAKHQSRRFNAEFWNGVDMFISFTQCRSAPRLSIVCQHITLSDRLAIALKGFRMSEVRSCRTGPEPNFPRRVRTIPTGWITLSDGTRMQVKSCFNDVAGY